MKSEIIAVVMILLLVIIVISCIRGIRNKRAGDHQKMLKELRRQHDRQVDRKVKLTRGQRFDCPACGSTSPCGRCQ